MLELIQIKEQHRNQLYVFSPAIKVSATATGAGLNDESGLEAYYDPRIADHIRFGPDG
jgi:hypothetical protein